MKRVSSKKIRNYLGRNLNKERTKDRLHKKARSNLMSKVRSRDTKFERDFIELLKKRVKNGFELNVNSVKGKPDILFRKQRIIIFLDSDFWHGWYYPRWKHLLKDNFWRNKIESNRKRDLKTTRHLRKNGWRVIRLWEHQIKANSDLAVSKIIDILRSRRTIR